MFNIACYCTAAAIHRLVVEQYLFFLLHLLLTCLFFIHKTVVVESYSGIIQYCTLKGKGGLYAIIRTEGFDVSLRCWMTVVKYG